MVLFCRAIYLDLHFFTHLINVLLSFFDHLKCLFPFLLELFLCLLNFFPLYPNPFLDLFFLARISSRGYLIVLEHFLDKLLFLALSVVQSFFSHFDKVHVFIVFHDLLEFVHCKLLEWVSFKQWLRWMAILIILVRGFRIN